MAFGFIVTMRSSLCMQLRVERSEKGITLGFIDLKMASVHGLMGVITGDSNDLNSI